MYKGVSEQYANVGVDFAEYLTYNQLAKGAKSIPEGKYIL